LHFISPGSQCVAPELICWYVLCFSSLLAIAAASLVLAGQRSMVAALLPHKASRSAFSKCTKASYRNLALHDYQTCP
jgi:hypothetical protein